MVMIVNQDKLEVDRLLLLMICWLSALLSPRSRWEVEHRRPILGLMEAAQHPTVHELMVEQSLLEADWLEWDQMIVMALDSMRVGSQQPTNNWQSVV